MLHDTGERVIPDLMKATNGLYLEHIARYYFSTPYVKGRVLDFASGSGYGTFFIAKTCKKDCDEVIGVDISEEAIAYANKRYHHPLVHYHLSDALDSNLINKIGQFDTILSFETIEHVKDDFAFLEQAFRLLKPGGKLILSTPFGKGRNEPCHSPFHYFQLTPIEFENLFRHFPFQKVEFYQQRGVTIENPRVGVKYYLGVAVATK